MKMNKDVKLKWDFSIVIVVVFKVFFTRKYIKTIYFLIFLKFIFDINISELKKKHKIINLK
jgi:hypothetical protein